MVLASSRIDKDDGPFSKPRVEVSSSVYSDTRSRDCEVLGGGDPNSSLLIITVCVSWM